MAFTKKTWNWKGLTTRLLLVPVVSGACASAAIAQQRTPVSTPAAAASSTPQARTFAEPKELVKQGRKALDAGQLDRAQDYAHQAASAREAKWGLFDDTPDSLLKDVATARGKADKVKAEQLLKDARTIFAKSARTPEERFANLEQATTMAYQAKNLHGDYGLFYFGDKPDSLLADIEATKMKLKKNMPAGAVMQAKNTTTPGAASGVKPALGTSKKGDASGIQTAGYTSKPTTPVGTAPNSAVKPQVTAMTAEARKLLAEGKFSEARAKAMAARQVADSGRVVFTSNEDTPDAVYQHVQSEGRKQIEALTKDGNACMARKDFAKADASFTMAAGIAKDLGLYTKEVDAKLAEAKKASGGTMMATGLPMPVVPTIPTAPETLVPAGPITVAGMPVVAPVIPSMNAAPVIPSANTAPVAPGMSTGKTMLAQAELELKANDLTMAKTLAIQAHTNDPACRADALALISTIEAEETSQKQRNAKASFTSAVQAYQAKQYEQALTLFKLIDPTHLTMEQKDQYATLCATCAAETGKGKVTQVAGQDIKPGVNPLVNEQQAMADLEFQKLRVEGNKTLSESQTAFGKGDTDLAMAMLQDYQGKVRASSMSSTKQALLLRPVENRLDTFGMLKRHTDVVSREARDRKEARDLTVGRSLAEAQRNEEIAKKVREINELQKAGKLAEAERLAAQTRQLDPDNPVLETIHNLAKLKQRRIMVKGDKEKKENFVLMGLHNAEQEGPYVDINNPLAIDPVRLMTSLRRGPADGGLIRTRTTTEVEIERKLDKTISVEFQNAPLKEVIAELRRKTELNIVFDEPAIADEKLPFEDATVTINLTQPISLRNALTLILSNNRMSYVIDKDVVQVTTARKSKGRLFTKVFQVMELVTPVPDFALAPHQSLTQAIAASRPVTPWMQAAGMNGQPNPGLRNAPGGLTGGQLVSPGGSGTPFLPSANSLEANLTGGAASSMSASATMAPTPNREFVAAKLKQLITKMISSSSWEDGGGPGRIEYFDAGAALVVNQTADVIQEISNLLESLRKLQDLSVSVEIRVVSLSESFFERIGVDFNMNIKTKNTSLDRSLATGSFRPQPFINGLDGQGTVGYSPATGITSDLGVPVRATSYNLTSPPFGGYQNFLSPTLNGGLSVGLAFLNDIQVYMFLEAASGDRRVNFMQAPKITLFNGQTSTVTVGDFAYFATNLQVFNFGGQTVYQPTNIAYPVGNAVNPTSGNQGVSVAVQAVVSADRRFVRLNLAPQLNSLASANVPLLPVTVFITPVFEGGSQGQPIPFTQFLQQPAFTNIEVQTTVSVPDGGTVLLGGLKAMAEGRDEFGPPVLSQIPYLNRLFKNVGIGRDTRHIMLMVTPRIIISSEEEMAQAPPQ